MGSVNDMGEGNIEKSKSVINILTNKQHKKRDRANAESSSPKGARNHNP